MKLQRSLILSFILIGTLIFCAPYSLQTRAAVNAEKRLQHKAASHTGKRKITETEVIHTAEEFIRENGYTQMPAMEDKTKLYRESFESGPRNPDELLKWRKGSLEPKAYKAQKAYPGWLVVFRYDGSCERFARIIPNYEKYIKEAGRAVTMDAYGGNIRIVHQDIVLDPTHKHP